MATYLIDSFDLTANGFGVRSVQGVEDIPPRKGETCQSWEDSDGIEPFTDAEDIILKAKSFFMELYLIAEDTAAAQEAMRSLELALFAPNARVVDISYYTSTIICYCKKEIQTTRLTKAEGGLVAYTVRLEFVYAND
jgi:hypothetical protein